MPAVPTAARRMLVWEAASPVGGVFLHRHVHFTTAALPLLPLPDTGSGTGGGFKNRRRADPHRRWTAKSCSNACTRERQLGVPRLPGTSDVGQAPP